MALSKPITTPTSISWPVIALPFIAALVLIAVAFGIDAHADYSIRSGHIYGIPFSSQSEGLVQLDLILVGGGDVNISWSQREGPEFLLSPRPSPSEFAVGDYVSATVYAGSAIDLTVDHNGRHVHYTSSFYKTTGVAAALTQTQVLTGLTVGALVAVAIWLVLATARAIQTWRSHGSRAAGASLFAATTFAPYLGLAPFLSVGGGHGGGIDTALSLLKPLLIVGFVSLLLVLVIFFWARAAEPGVRAELRMPAVLAAAGAVPWLIMASLLLAISSGSTF